MKIPKLCEFCKKKVTTKSFHCNHCVKKHSICEECIKKNMISMNLRKVNKNSVFDSNLKKWT